MPLPATLPRSAYLDEGVWATERERIFARQWVCVGRAAAVAGPGDWVRVSVAGESVVLVRGDDSVVRGFHNVCRHRGAEVAPTDGPACGRAPGGLRCSYHGWLYGLDGSLRRTPFLEDRLDDAERAALGLHPVEVALWGGFVFVRIDGAGGPGLGEQLGPVAARVARYPLEELVVGVELRYEVAANWKVLAENYNECYHCGPVHPELCRLVPAFGRGGTGVDWAQGVPHRDGAWTFTTSGTTTRAPFGGLSEAERTRHFGELAYPNLWLSLSADHVAAFVSEPAGPATTHMRCLLLFHPDETAREGFDPSDAAELWDLVNAQDWAVCERVQRGMGSRVFTHGYYAPMEDESADIARWYTRVMAP